MSKKCLEHENKGDGKPFYQGQVCDVLNIKDQKDEVVELTSYRTNRFVDTISDLENTMRENMRPNRPAVGRTTSRINDMRGAATNKDTPDAVVKDRMALSKLG